MLFCLQGEGGSGSEAGTPVGVDPGAISLELASGADASELSEEESTRAKNLHKRK